MIRMQQDKDRLGYNSKMKDEDVCYKLAEREQELVGLKG